MKTFKNRIIAIVALVAIAASSGVAAVPSEGRLNDEQMNKKVRKELVTLPYYGVFDNLAYKIEGDTVTLYGQVVRPSTRRDAEYRVARIAGVRRVVNNIEVLPLSPFDDSIRRQTYRQVFNTAGLYRYAMGVNPSLHIIVNRGHVTLEGVVATQADKQFAYVVASSVPGVFSVTNNLRAERGERKY